MRVSIYVFILVDVFFLNYYMCEGSRLGGGKCVREYLRSYFSGSLSSLIVKYVRVRVSVEANVCVSVSV